jgi:hypothetical protein
MLAIAKRQRLAGVGRTVVPARRLRARSRFLAHPAEEFNQAIKQIWQETRDDR